MCDLFHKGFDYQKARAVADSSLVCDPAQLLLVLGAFLRKYFNSPKESKAFGYQGGVAKLEAINMESEILSEWQW